MARVALLFGYIYRGRGYDTHDTVLNIKWVGSCFRRLLLHTASWISTTDENVNL